MVTKRQRLEAALAGELVDRPPVALWRHFPVDDQDPERLAQATLAFQREFDFDFVKVTPASSFCVRDWGVKDAWKGNPEGTRDYYQHAVQRPEQWRQLTVLDPQQGSLQAQLRCLELLGEGLAGEVPYIQTIFSPLSQAKNLVGSAGLWEMLHRDPDSFEAGLETITRSTIAFLEQARERGIDGIFYAVQHASYKYFDPESYLRFGEQHDRRILEAADGLWLNVLHLHGEALMFDLAGRLPAAVVNWHDREVEPSLAEGRRLLERAVLGGVGRMSPLVLGEPERVADEARQSLESLGSRGVILGTGCVVPIIAPRANLMALRQAVEFV